MDIVHHYTETGEGNPLILLHGNSEDCGYFSAQTDAFSDAFRVIAIDTRGHGLTPRGTAPFTIRQFADDLACFMEEHSISKADIVGFSDGANIAMAFALKYPDKTCRLVLDGGNLYPSGMKFPILVSIVSAYILNRALSPFSGKARAKAEMLGLMARDPYIYPKELGGIQAPTLVIAGTSDMIRASHTRLIARSVPGARLRIIEGDHFVAAGNPRDFNAAVLDFLTGNKR